MDTGLRVFRVAIPYDYTRSFLAHQDKTRPILLAALDDAGYELHDGIAYQRDGNSFAASVVGHPAGSQPPARPWDDPNGWRDELFDLIELRQVIAERHQLRPVVDERWPRRVAA